MNKVDKDSEIFEALLVAASSEAMRRELDALPSNEELNTLYKSDALDARIAKIIEQDEQKKRRKRMLKSLGRIAASIAIVLTLTVSVLMSVEATRVRIINAFLDWRADHVQIRPNNEGSNVKNNNSFYRPTYLPEGYFEVEIYSYGNTFESVYTNNEGDEINLQQSPAESTVLNIDNEHSDYYKIEISGNEAHLFVSFDDDTQNQMVWVLDETLFTLSSFINHEELILIAESIK